MKRKATYQDHECCICLNPLEDIVPFASCRHSFHKVCITKWIRTSIQQGNAPTCPLCRGGMSLECLASLDMHMADDWVCQVMLFPPFVIHTVVCKKSIRLFVREGTLQDQLQTMTDLLELLQGALTHVESCPQIMFCHPCIVNEVLVILPRSLDKRARALSMILDEVVCMYDRVLMEAQCLVSCAEGFRALTAVP